MNKLMLTYLGVEFLFLACAGLLLGYALIGEQVERSTPTTSNVPYMLLLSQMPLTASIINAIFMFFVFLISLPALAMPMNRGWLKLQGWLVVSSAVFTLIIGLFIWFSTLQVRKNLGVVYAMQSSNVQGLMQTRFACCGFDNSTSPMFVTDSACPNPTAAAATQGCVGPFASFTGIYLDFIFTAAFGIVGVDVLLLLCVVMVIKYRGELERYRHIDEKNGVGF